MYLLAIGQLKSNYMTDETLSSVISSHVLDSLFTIKFILRVGASAWPDTILHARSLYLS